MALVLKVRHLCRWFLSERNGSKDEGKAGGWFSFWLVYWVLLEKGLGLKFVRDSAQKCFWGIQKWWWRRTRPIDRFCLDPLVKRSCCISAELLAVNYFCKKLHWILLWCNITFLCLSCNLEFTLAQHCFSKHMRVLVKLAKPYLEFYKPLLSLCLLLCTFKSSFLDKFLYLSTCGACCQGGKKYFPNACYFRINNVTVSRS